VSRTRYAFGALAGLAAAVFVLEILVRFLVMGPGTLLTADADIGKVPVKGTHILRATEGYGHTRYAGDGEIATPFEGGDVVVVLGDSHTEALQVDDAAKFVSVAETDLRRRGRTFDLRNLGFSGGTMADYVRLGPSIIARYHPAILVIQLSPADFGPETFDPGHVNHFIRAGDGSLRLMHLDAHVGKPSLGARVKHASALVTYIQVRYLKIAERTSHESATNREGDAAPHEVIPFDTVPAQLNLLRHAYPGLPVILLVLPFVPRIESGTIVAADPDYEKLLDIMRTALHDVPEWHVVDPLPQFRELEQRGKLPRGFVNTRPGSGHLNAAGHRIVGDLLAAAIDKARP